MTRACDRLPIAKRVARDIERYLQKGGKITVIPPGVSAIDPAIPPTPMNKDQRRHLLNKEDL